MDRKELEAEVIRRRINSRSERCTDILLLFEGRISPTQVAERLDIKRQNASAYIKDLRIIGAVEEVEPDVDDKRVKHYKIQDEFKRVAEEYQQA